jgi:ABC-type transport system involved in multi-copper enzyme maturation permease subunit
MTIFAPNYAPPPPPLESGTRRVQAILDHQVRQQIGVLNIVLLVFIYLTVVVPLVLIFYFTSFLPGPIFGQGTLSTFYEPIGGAVWYVLLILLASSAGASVIARDVATKAITMYLARPIRPIDYLAAKSGALAFWMFIGGVLPGWIAVFIVLALGYVSLFLALQAAAGYLLVGLLLIGAFSGVAVLFSSLTARSTLAGAGTFGTLLGSYIVVSVLAGVSGKATFYYASPVADVLSVGAAVFNVSGSPIDPWSAAAVLVGLALATFGLSYVRLLRNQVIAE